MTASARPRSRPRSIACARSAISSASAAPPARSTPSTSIILQAKGSLFATRPTLNHYVAKREDLLSMAADLFKVVGSGAVKIPINHKYRAQGRRQGAQGDGRPRDHGLDRTGSLTLRRRDKRGDQLLGLRHAPPDHPRPRYRVGTTGGGLARGAAPRRALCSPTRRPMPTAAPAVARRRCVQARQL